MKRKTFLAALLASSVVALSAHAQLVSVPLLRFLGTPPSPAPTLPGPSLSTGFITGWDSQVGTSGALGLTATKNLLWIVSIKATNLRTSTSGHSNTTAFNSNTWAGINSPCEPNAASGGSPATQACGVFADNSPGGDGLGLSQFSWCSSPCTSGAAGVTWAKPTDDYADHDGWNTYAFALDGANTVMAVNVNGTDMDTSAITVPNVTWDMNNSNGLGFGGRVLAGQYGFADVLISTGDQVVCHNTSPITIAGVSYACSGPGVFPTNFIHDRVYSSAARREMGAQCLNVTGRQPEVCIRGGVSTALTNEGTASNAFGLFDSGNAIPPTTTSFANKELISPAAGPGGALHCDPSAHKVCWKWIASDGQGPVLSGNLTMPAGSEGRNIALGDYLLAYEGISANTSVNHAIGKPTYTDGSDAGFTCLGPDFEGIRELYSTNICTKFATATDVTKSAAAVSTGAGIFLIPWTTSTDIGHKGWALFNFGQSVNATTPMDLTLSSVLHSANSSTHASPTASTTIANETVLYFFGSADHSALSFPDPSGTERLFFTPNANDINLNVSAAYNVASGTATAKTVVGTGTDSATVWVVGLVPN